MVVVHVSITPKTACAPPSGIFQGQTCPAYRHQRQAVKCCCRKLLHPSTLAIDIILELWKVECSAGCFYGTAGLDQVSRLCCSKTLLQHPPHLLAAMSSSKNILHGQYISDSSQCLTSQASSANRRPISCCPSRRRLCSLLRPKSPHSICPFLTLVSFLCSVSAPTPHALKRCTLLIPFPIAWPH